MGAVSAVSFSKFKTIVRAILRISATCSAVIWTAGMWMSVTHSRMIATQKPKNPTTTDFLLALAAHVTARAFFWLLCKNSKDVV